MISIDKEVIKKNAHLIVIAIILFVFFVFFVLRTVFFLLTPPNNSQRVINEGNGTGASEETTPQGKEITRRESLVGGLIDKTPFNGKNFSFYYSYSKSEFILYVSPTQQASGNQEFDAFLRQNGVQRSWIRHLVTTNTRLNPAP